MELKGTIINTMSPKVSTRNVMWFFVKLPAVVQVYLSTVSLMALLISDQVLLKAIGFIGTLVTAALAGFRYFRDKRNDRIINRLETSELASRARIEQLTQENQELKAAIEQSARDRAILEERAAKFEAERAQFRSGIETRVSEIERKVQ